ncbi:Platinum sensitivity protein [Pleurotus ostreatus]|nr:Platinum sensitivity protein [Pleurotus ostreatus]
MDRSEATAEANDQQPLNVDPQDPPSSSSKIQPDAASATSAQPTDPDSVENAQQEPSDRTLNGFQQVELVEHTPGGAEADAGGSQDDPHDWFPDSDYELKRVKVYELIGSRWVDQGTAFCFGQFNDETNEALLIARSESNYAEVILSTTIRSNDVYQRQQDTLIVWTEPDGVDYALSFQDPEGCSEVWNFILEVQRHLNREEPGLVGSSSPTPGNSDSVAAANVIRSGHLPQPQLGIIGEIEKVIKSLSRTQPVKERMCEYIQHEEYIKQLVDVLHQAEDLENLENLHALCSLMQTILLLNDHGLYEHILEESLFFGVVGMLEYDPEFPDYKANYRDFLVQTTQFHQPIAIVDQAIVRKIHHTYRLQFLKDVVLARVLDDSTFNVLSSCIIFNQIDIITHVQQDPRFLMEVVKLYVDEDMLSGGGRRASSSQGPGTQGFPLSGGMGGGLVVVKLENADEDASVNGKTSKDSVFRKSTDTDSMDVDQKSPVNGLTHTVVNGQVSRSSHYSFAPPEELSEAEVTLRREVIFLIQQLCVMAKNVQLPARMALFRTLVDRGVLFAVQWAVGLPEKLPVNLPIIAAGGEILAALLDHDLTGVRGHVLKQVTAIEKEKDAGKKGADKAETILAMVCRILIQSRDLAVQSLVGDALKVWMDIPLNDGTEAAHQQQPGVKMLPRGKDDPGTEKYMEYFYNGNCIHTLLRPFNDIPPWQDFKELRLPLTREQTNLYVYLCDLLCNFSLQHSFRSHFLVLTSNISIRIATLLKARDKHLQHAAFRFFRILVKQNNRNMHQHLLKHDIFKPILDLTLQESRRDNLLSSSCHELFEIIRKENMKELIHHCMTKHEEQVRKLAGTPLGGSRFQQFIRRWEMNIEPLPVEDKNTDAKRPDARGWPGGRAVDAEEEDYFNNDDESDLASGPLPITMQQWTRGGPAPLSPLPGEMTLKRKRRPAIAIPPRTLKLTNISPLRSPLPLVDYGDDDEPSPGDDGKMDAQQKPNTPQSSTYSELPPSPKLSHRQIPSSVNPTPKRPPAEDEDEEDGLLEALVTGKITSTSSALAPSLDTMKPGEKRRRNDDDDDGLLERLAKIKKQQHQGPDTNSVPSVRSKSGDDPPKKIKVKFGLGSLAVAQPPSTTPSPSAASEGGVKDGDTG